MADSRRKFIKKTASILAALPLVGAANPLLTNNILSSNSLSNMNNEELLHFFSQWVDEYVDVVKQEKLIGRKFKDNKALVELPAQMDKMMPVFKERFSEPDFMKSYLQISRKLSQAIDSKF